MEKVYVVTQLVEVCHGTFEGKETILSIFSSEEKAIDFISDAIKEDREHVKRDKYNCYEVDSYLNRNYGVISEYRWVYSNTCRPRDTRVYYKYESFVLE